MKIVTRTADETDVAAIGAILLIQAGGDITIPWADAMAALEGFEGDDDEPFVLERVEGQHVRLYLKK